MRSWRRAAVVVLAAVTTTAGLPQAPTTALAFQGTFSPAYLDQLLAPIALYPDQLLAQMLLCSENSTKVGEFSQWLKANASLKGSDLQKAAEMAKVPPSFIALTPFSQVVDLMAGNLTWTSQIGGAFAVDKNAVFESIQRLRKQSQTAGNLKSTPQQTVVNKSLEGGEQVIVIEPANPQVVYVPQYNPQTVYTTSASSTTVVTTAPTTTTVIVQEDDDDDGAAVAGALIGFTAGIAIGASMNNYYYGPYGYRGGAYMYGGGYNDWYDDREDAREDYYDNREDAREDWQDHREDMGGERSERAQNAQEQRTERTEQRGSAESQAQREQQRTERQQSASPEAQAKRTEAKTQAQGKVDSARASGTTAQGTGARTQSAGTQSRGSGERTGTRSDAFSGYSSGSSTRAASSRGERSRSSSGGSRGSRSGGGRRR